MGTNFEDWAYSYFAEEGEHVNQYIQRDIAYDDFIAFSKVPKSYWTMQRFTKALKGFTELCPYIDALNPEEMLNSTGRLLKKVDGQDKRDDLPAHVGEARCFSPKIDKDGNLPF